MKNQHKNFTLVELAVIIFCCAAITAVTLPLAHGTVEQAKSITCMNKLKNIGQAALQYAKSNSNIVPCRVRDAKTGTVNDFGNWFHVWSKALIWGGYFSEKPTVSYNAGNVKYGKEYFGCPDDKNLHNDKKSTGSYIIFNLNRKAVELAGNRFGFSPEEYARLEVGRDRAENAIVFDYFPYNGSPFKAAVHGNVSNVLRLNGEVDTVNITKGRRTPNFYKWFGEDVDGIEL